MPSRAKLGDLKKPQQDITHCLRWFTVGELPDPGDSELASRFGGDLRAAAAQAAEQVLRMISGYADASVALSIRWEFNPSALRQSRSRLLLGMRVDSPHADDIVDSLINAGPFSGIYRIADWPSDPGNPISGAVPLDLGPELTACCEILRREESFESDPQRCAHNSLIPPVYYTIVPFQARDGADGLPIDRLLDHLDSRVVIDLLVQSVDSRTEWKVQYAYVTGLLGINQFGEDPSEAAKFEIVGRDGIAQPVSPHEPKSRDPIADDIAREQQEIHNLLRKPQLLFHAKIWAEHPETASLVAATLAESTLVDGKYFVLSFTADEKPEWWQASLQASRDLQVSDLPRNPASWESHQIKSGRLALRRLARLATADELKSLVRLPIAGRSSPRTLRKSTDPTAVPRFNDRGQPVASILLGDDLELDDQERNFWDMSDLSPVFEAAATEHPEIRLPVKLLPKHVFVAGVPGSGKTTALFNVLVQLHRLRIPFLVIEPAKTEYRTLKLLRDHPDPSISDLARSLRIFTAGNEDISPFRFNPFEYPNAKGITLDEHISTLISCFRGAMPLFGPLEALISSAVDRVYSTRRDAGPFPKMCDLVDAARDIMEETKYEGEIKGNLTAAIEVRLGLLVRRSVGKMLDSEESVPSIEQLLQYPTVIEMDYLSQEQACLMSLFLLSAIREYIRCSRPSGVGLQHVIVLEEAHNIVGRSGGQSGEDSADPRGFAADYVSRMLAELRALGEGIVIADQLPSTVAPQVVKNTGTKLSFRLVSKDDREDLGAAMLLDGHNLEDLARLRPGQAYFYTEGLYLPRKIRTLASHEYLALRQPLAENEKRPELPPSPSRQALSRLVAEEDWFQDAIERRAELRVNRLGRIAGDLELHVERGRRIRDALDNLLTAAVWSLQPPTIDALMTEARDWRSVNRTKYSQVFDELDRQFIPNEWAECSVSVKAEVDSVRARLARLIAAAQMLVHTLAQDCTRLESYVEPLGLEPVNPESGGSKDA